MSSSEFEYYDVLLTVFSYLPQKDVLEEARYVSRGWLEVASRMYTFLDWMNGSSIIVDPLVETENQWRYRTLQAAIDNCTSGSIISVDVISEGVTDV